MTDPVATDTGSLPQEPSQPTAAASARGNGPVPDSGVFLQDLVDAMRQITEEARDQALSQLRASLDQRSGDLRSATDQRATDLREEAEAEIVKVGEWEQTELQRTRDEAAGKVAARRAKLDAQLSANAASGETALGAVQARIEAFEREMAAFFAQLNDLHDPVAFASAAKRMPRSPSLTDTPVAPAEHIAPTPAATPTPDEAEAPAAAAEWLSQPEADAPRAALPAPAPEPEAAAAEAQPVEVTAVVPAVAAEPQAAAEPASPAPEPEAWPEPEPEAEETSTQVMVTGLTSFGAITSFKQSLERAAGVRRVSMGLGASGEFIFTAVHPVGFDLAEAIRSFEGTAQFVPSDDHLRVTVGAKA